MGGHKHAQHELISLAVCLSLRTESRLQAGRVTTERWLYELLPGTLSISFDVFQKLSPQHITPVLIVRGDICCLFNSRILVL
jgi:hypothetical protein